MQKAIYTVSYPLIMWLMIIIHILWGVSIFMLKDVGWITALYIVKLPPFLLGTCLIISSILVIYSLYFGKSRLMKSCLCMPQQTLSYASAFGALAASIAGSYGDGVMHPKLFIFADQFPTILLAIFHNIAIVRYNAR